MVSLCKLQSIAEIEDLRWQTSQYSQVTPGSPAI